MTKVLLISNKDDITTDFVVRKLRQSNIEFYRFNTEDLTISVHFMIDFASNKYLLYDSIIDKEINLLDIKSVYYRRPEIPVVNIENISKGESMFIQNELIYTLEGIYKILRNANWLNPLYSIREAENKLYQISLAKEIGFIIPNSLITNRPKEANLFFVQNKKDCIIKPIKSGLVGEISDSKVIFTSKLPYDSDFNSICNCPTYIQSNIHKKADIRVTAVNGSYFSARIHSQERPEALVDWRKTDCVLEYSKIDLPIDIEEKCNKLMRKLNLRFGAIDFIETENGDFVFLEINPNGQWAWIEQQLKFDISGTILKQLAYE